MARENGVSIECRRNVFYNRERGGEKKIKTKKKEEEEQQQQGEEEEEKEKKGVEKGEEKTE